MTDPITSAMILKTAVMAVQTIVMAYALFKFVSLSRKWRKEAAEEKRREIEARFAMLEIKHRMEAEHEAEKIEEAFGVEAADKFYASVMYFYDRDKTEKPKHKRKNDDESITQLESDYADRLREIALPMDEAMAKLWAKGTGDTP